VAAPAEADTVVVDVDPVINIPLPDFSSIRDVQERKHLFFTFIYENIKPINQSILNDRERLITLNNKTKLNDDEIEWLSELAYNYRVISEKDNDKTKKQIMDELLVKVDVIPPALVLAQAASESGWGTSRFAKEANNYFGIWCWKKSCGIRPLRRQKNRYHRVRLFPEAKDSILYYTKLLNNKSSYSKLREIRAKLRKDGKPIVGEALLPGILLYSERGEAYTDEIAQLIRHNKLEEKYPAVL